MATSFPTPSASWPEYEKLFTTVMQFFRVPKELRVTDFTLICEMDKLPRLVLGTNMPVDFIKKAGG